MAFGMQRFLSLSLVVEKIFSMMHSFTTFRSEGRKPKNSARTRYGFYFLFCPSRRFRAGRLEA